MKTQLFLLTCLLLSINVFSQTNFESGYLIKTNDTKVDCFIKNEDWKSNPTTFEYKLMEDGEIKIGNLTTVKEFGSGESFKYIKATVDVDQSNDKVENLSDERNPLMKEETHFLRTVVEGNATLYYASKNNENRFFYKMNDGEIEQLIYKRYLVSVGKIGKNNRYKQQLANTFNCSQLVESDFANVSYTFKKLVSLFNKYNTCNNSASIEYNKKEKGHWFNLSVRPGVIFSSVQLGNPYGDDIDFGQKTGFRLGLEMEFVLPFNNDKWAFLVEPTYRTYSGEAEIQYVDFLTIKKYTTVNLTHTSIAIPIGMRHYFFLNEQSKIFINGGIVVDAIIKREVDSSDENKFDFNSTNESDLKGNAELGFSFGLGFKFKNKFSVEANITPSREIFEYNSISSSYNSFSIILGYSIF